MKTATTNPATETTNDRDAVIALAFGRIFRMGSRPTQPGDIEEYERCRAIIMAAAGSAS